MTTGKWAQQGVPHKGWRCVDIVDLDAPAATCEMCETTEIRFVHVMAHADYPGELRCGCICAGHMEQDLTGARKREAVFKATLRRRKNWLARRWWTTLRGADYLNVDGFHVSVWPHATRGFVVKVEHRRSGERRYSQRHYATMDAAKLAAFDVMVRWP